MGLVAYKSSAGSGKTHTLVKDYLKITLREPENKFRHVLAITFTNKAAGEMKERVLESLKSFASGNTNNQLAETLKNELNIDDITLKKQSDKLLGKIIHNFDDFHISTIDSFVHKIIKTFSKEVELPSDFEVVLEIEDIIPEILENIYNRLVPDKNDTFTKFMINFVDSLTDDEKNYDPQQPITQFIKKQTEEGNFYEVNKLDKLSLNDFFVIIGKIKKKLNVLEEKIKDTGNKSRELLKKNGLTEKDFINKRSNIVTYLLNFNTKIDLKDIFPKKTVLKSIYEDKWYSNSTSKEVSSVIDTVKDRLTNFFHQINNAAQEYYFLKSVYDKLYKVALIKEISELFKEYSLTTAKVHISEFNKRISQTISEQSAPFIYERLGNKFQHFLIDEFQDTSVMQWYNLFPLIENSYSTADEITGKSHFNMLVGDPKQAIYRFRGGEVELFTTLPKLYGDVSIKDKKIKEEFLEEVFEEQNLDTNYRSYKNIVEFNNSFFDFISATKQGLIKNIYSGHHQKVSSQKNHDGYVSIELIKAENAADYDEKRLEKIENYILELKEKEFDYNDICILTRTTKQGAEIANYLLEHNIPVISSESLLIANSAKVRFVVAFFKALLQADNPEAITELIRNYLIINNSLDNFNNLLSKSITQKITLPELLSLLNINIDLESLNQKTLLEKAIIIFESINYQNTNNIYFQYFIDFLLEKENVINNSLDNFLELWNEKKDNLFIVIPEGENAVKIMTIHKSKGLKFQVVILDNIDRITKNSREEQWINPQIDEIPELSTTLFPLKKINSENEVIYKNINLTQLYEKESEKTELDRINLIYVAFTRAVEALFIMSSTKDNGKTPDLNHFSKTMNQYINWEKNFTDNSANRIEIGTLKKLDKNNPGKKNYISIKEKYGNAKKLPVAIAPAEEIYWNLTDNSSNSTKGKLFHNILSEIKTKNDIEKTLNTFVNKGIIDQQEQQHIKHKINEIINHPLLEKYFSEKATIKTEMEIITKEGEIIRPDRIVYLKNKIVIIDYKTGNEQQKHIIQVKNYMEKIKNLYNTDIEGVLIYLGDKITVKQV